MSMNSIGGYSPTSSVAQFRPPTASPKSDGLFVDKNSLEQIANRPSQLSPSCSAEHQISAQAHASQVQANARPPSYSKVMKETPVASARVAPAKADDNDQPKPAGKMTRFGRYCMGKLHAAWDKLCDGIVYVADKLGTACDKGRFACVASFRKHSGARAGLAGFGVLCFLGTQALCGGVKYTTKGVKWFVPKATEFLVFTAVPKTVSFIYHACRMAGKGAVRLGAVGAK